MDSLIYATEFYWWYFNKAFKSKKIFSNISIFDDAVKIWLDGDVLKSSNFDECLT